MDLSPVPYIVMCVKVNQGNIRHMYLMGKDETSHVPRGHEVIAHLKHGYPIDHEMKTIHIQPQDFRDIHISLHNPDMSIYDGNVDNSFTFSLYSEHGLGRN